MLFAIIELIAKCIQFGRHLCLSSTKTTRISSKLLYVVLVLYFLALLPFVQPLAHPKNQNHQIHKRMSQDDLRHVFQVESHTDVPEYDLTNIRIINKRSVDQSSDHNGLSPKQIHLNAFGKKLELNLQKNNEFNDRIKDMKVFMAESTSNGKLRYSEAPTNAQENRNIGTTYHDNSNLAAILVDHNSDGSIQLHGTIGNDLVIRPVPQTVSLDNTEYLTYNEDDGDDEMFLDEDEAIEANRQQIRDNQSLNQTNTSVNTTQVFLSQLPISTTARLTDSQVNDKNRTNQRKSHNAHIVFKRNMFDKESHSDYLELDSKLPEMGLDFNSTSESTSGERRSSRNKRQAPQTVWPEVLLVVDHDSYILHGGTSRDVKRYFISFWNGVDLRYKLLGHPQIRVSLAGMIVAKDRDATPYLERNRLRSPNADAVDAAGALTDMGKYLYREDRLPTYDLAVVITKLDMCRRRYEGGRCNRGTAGFAYVGGACVVNKRLEKVNSVAIIEDSGGFSGIIVAAHEVGHLLGCVHDGSPPPSYLGGPGATRCPWEDGFIMSDLRHTERGFRWSSCSVEQFKHFLNGETATCLYNFPHENQLLPRVLPGTMLSLDEQCKRDRGTNACFKDARVCAQLFCFDSASGYCVSYRPAAEGSQCGDGQVCRNGKCLAEIENIIPDYTRESVSRLPAPNLMSRSDVGSVRRIGRYRNNRLGRGLARHVFSPHVRLAMPTIESPQVSVPANATEPDQSEQGQTEQEQTDQRHTDQRHTDQRHTDQGQADQGQDQTQTTQANKCNNNVERMAGSLTCTQFLERFGDKYCKHDYIKRNCCASHALMCKKPEE